MKDNIDPRMSSSSKMNKFLNIIKYIKGLRNTTESKSKQDKLDAIAKVKKEVEELHHSGKVIFDNTILENDYIEFAIYLNEEEEKNVNNN